MRSTSSPRAAAQLATQVQTVLPRQHEIEHQQVDVRALHDARLLPAIGNRGGAELVLLEILGEQAANLAIVVYDQQVRTVVHRRRIPGQRTADSEFGAAARSVLCNQLLGQLWCPQCRGPE